MRGIGGVFILVLILMQLVVDTIAEVTLCALNDYGAVWPFQSIRKYQ